MRAKVTLLAGKLAIFDQLLQPFPGCLYVNAPVFRKLRGGHATVALLDGLVVLGKFVQQV